MYKIFGFNDDEVFGRVAEVEFSTPLRGRYAYLLGDFNAFNEGSLRMRRDGGRWRLRMRLPEGLWHYAFSIEGDYRVDDENPDFERYLRPSYKFDRLTSVVEINGRNPIFHSPSLLYLYAVFDGVHVMLRGRRDVAKSVSIVLNKEGSVEEFPMRRIASDEVFDYFEAVLTERPQYRALTYRFSVETDEGNVKYGPFSGRPYTIHHPEWVKDAMFYQIMPSRYGGLNGITKALDHITFLGFNSLYLTPIFESTAYHGYDIVDYLKVSKRLGGMGAFRALMRRVKTLDIRLMLDGVFHHTSFFHPYFQDVVNNGRESPYVNFYRVLGFPVVSRAFLEALKADMPSKEKRRRLKEIGWNYESFFKVWLMPRLNHDNNNVRRFVADVLKYWDDVTYGWRLDVAHGVPPNFWDDVLGGYMGSKYLIGEVMDDPSIYLGKFHGFMNYPLYDAMLGFFVSRDMKAEKFLNRIELINAKLGPFRYLSYNFLDNHDTPRFLDLVNDKRVYLCALTFLFTYVGIPSILYGDEVGLRGIKRDGLDSSRSEMTWDRRKWDLTLYEAIKRLAHLRKTSRAIKEGRFVPLRFAGRFLSYERSYGDERVRVYINLRESEEVLKLLRSYTVIYGELEGDKLPPLSSAVVVGRAHVNSPIR